MITLNAQEREYFAAYLDQEAKSDQIMVEQMDRLGNNESIVKRYRLIAAARLIVAKDLRRIEIQEVG
jgi:hypothetical protein